jgi:hypothetical protein
MKFGGTGIPPGPTTSCRPTRSRTRSDTAPGQMPAAVLGAGSDSPKREVSANDGRAGRVPGRIQVPGTRPACCRPRGCGLLAERADRSSCRGGSCRRALSGSQRGEGLLAEKGLCAPLCSLLAERAHARSRAQPPNRTPERTRPVRQDASCPDSARQGA